MLTTRFHLCIPQLVPAGFDISPLPSEISCFIIRVLQILEWFHQLGVMPQAIWVHCSGVGFNGAPFTSSKEAPNYSPPSRPYCRRSTRRTHRPNDRKPPLPSSFGISSSSSQPRLATFRSLVPWPSTALGLCSAKNHRNHPRLERADDNLVSSS